VERLRQESVNLPVELKEVIDLLDELKVENIDIYNVRKGFPFADYFIIGTALSKTHLKAVSDKFWERFKGDIVGEDGEPQSGWIIIDVRGAWVHVFLEDMRKYYSLEELWSKEFMEEQYYD